MVEDNVFLHILDSSGKTLQFLPIGWSQNVLICISEIINEIECNFIGLLASIFFPECYLLHIFSSAYFLSFLSRGSQ